MAPQNAYVDYYLAQAGGNMNHFAGLPYQRGYGIGSWLGGLFRTVLPFLRSGAMAVGQEAARAGSHVLADLASGQNLKASVTRHVEEAGNNLVTQLKRKAQGGGGAIKRRKAKRPSHSIPYRRRVKTVHDQLS